MAADGVGLVAAVQGDELEIVLHFRVQETDQLLEGVAALFVDIVSAMAALGACDGDFEGFVAFAEGLALKGESGGGVHAAGAADE